MLKTKGVLLLAVKHSNYVKMAFNLALSLKIVNHDVLIHLVTDVNYNDLSDKEKQLFDSVSIIEEEIKEPFYLKTTLYKYSPFDETIVMDVDSIWLPQNKISDLFKLFKSENFAFTCYSEDGYYPVNSDKSLFWNAENDCINDINKIFKFDKKAIFYNIQSTFLYFKKSKESDKIFSFAEERFRLKDFNYFEFAGAMGDEFAFAIAIAQANYKVKVPYQSIFYYPLNVHLCHLRERKKLFNDFYFMSLAGNRQSKDFINFYDDLVLWYYAKKKNLDSNKRYKWNDKNKFIGDRKQY